MPLRGPAHAHINLPIASSMRETSLSTPA
jgi:hypothetical protein